MKKLRALLILLICIALPYSATAAMLQGMQCHHDGLGGIAAASDHADGDHAMHEHHHHDSDSAKASGDHGCDCAVKCSCEHHCATSCSVASTAALGSADTFLATATDHGLTAYMSHVSDVHGRSVFRPPITALTSAA